MALMFAYGSNLNIGQMAERCPRATPIGHLVLPGWRLVFRGVADCMLEEGACCYGGVWKITPACEYALDIYEGIASGMYRKEYIPIKRLADGTNEMLIYVMNSTGIMPPSRYYLDVIKQGYRDFSMPRKAHSLLHDAVKRAWDDKAPSHIERQRRMRTGRPALAPRPKDKVPAPAAS